MGEGYAEVFDGGVAGVVENTVFSVYLHGGGYRSQGTLML